MTLSVFNNTLVSIIIVNYNGLNYLKDCLKSLQRTSEISYETILVDNASTDGSAEWIINHYPDIRVMKMQNNLGFGRANHIGSQMAKGQILVFLNNDTLVTPSWLVKLVMPLISDKSIGATCSTLILLDHPEVINARGGGMTSVGFSFDIDYGYYAGFDALSYKDHPENLVKDVFFPSGAAMAIEKKDFDNLGFDSAMFMYHEDVDLGWRLWLSGKRVVVCTGSVILHKFGGASASQMGSLWRDYMGIRHNLRSLWKNYELRNAIANSRQLFSMWHKEKMYLTMLNASLWNLQYLFNTFGERRRIQRTRFISDDELFNKGLIRDSIWPAPSPKVPTFSVSRQLEKIIESDALYPGEYSGAGRLGFGWYGEPDFLDGSLARMTSGMATCFLKTKPNLSGTLKVWLHVPEMVCHNSRLKFICNGKENVCTPTGALWDCVSMPVEADQSGILSVKIFTENTWIPDNLFYNNDLRKAGCLIKELRFFENPASQNNLNTNNNYATVVITTFNRHEILARNLKALKDQDCKNFDVVVVDDGSVDDTWKILEEWKNINAEFPLTIARQVNTGQSEARNHALKYAKNDFIIFIGDDIIVEPDFVRKHLEKHKELKEPCAVVGYTDWDCDKMLVTSSLKHVNQEGHQFGYRYLKNGQETPFTCFYTSNLSLPRKILAVESFNPEFKTYGWEDIELGYRLQNYGLRIIYAADAKAKHLHPMTLRNLYTRQLKIGRSIHHLYRLQPELINNPFMPAQRRLFRWRGYFHTIVQPLLYVINYLDQKGGKIPPKVLNFLLSVAFYRGYLEGR